MGCLVRSDGYTKRGAARNCSKLETRRAAHGNKVEVSAFLFVAGNGAGKPTFSEECCYEKQTLDHVDRCAPGGHLGRSRPIHPAGQRGAGKSSIEPGNARGGPEGRSKAGPSSEGPC